MTANHNHLKYFTYDR